MRDTIRGKRHDPASGGDGRQVTRSRRCDWVAASALTAVALRRSIWQRGSDSGARRWSAVARRFPLSRAQKAGHFCHTYFFSPPFSPPLRGVNINAQVCIRLPGQRSWAAVSDLGRLCQDFVPRLCQSTRTKKGTDDRMSSGRAQAAAKKEHITTFTTSRVWARH